ncbi:phenylalanine--tRNA ligase subunit beta [Vagococcus xieshaowenii]|uniref:Phenylalanine--tRNA ligase beta subunit n=1 Tax=Vagococcus xieshaowenii TaxID=2562451 RepID=A0AAJ5JMQ1_9ENTE|nr:phenylalanine--tRNA ligase subunit beta [Vagococcus xieshaowenii]QCA28399.1 phenylalanine--tRNA ligase subunit beta [Vagococcus xieshaowenii]TFZ42845.1 phenylalanine--tRNA ligase subunit beta [Vagococcus xieshaowenii]
MLVSYKWLQDYLDLSNTNPTELADKMSRTGIEVEEVNIPSEGLKKIVVGHVKERRDHENSDHLSVCQVDVGEEDYQIVCGAPNVDAGQNVIVALPGARIVDNIKIKKSKMRGEVSMGMICSLEELGYSESIVPKAYSDGIYILPESAVPGEEVFPYLAMDDAIIELSITPNRADALSMRGVAHEVGAIYRQQPVFETVKLVEDMTDSADNYLSVKVEDVADAPNYRMRIVKDVTIKESPMWLQTRLMNAGIRPHNNIVDVTNYALLLYGQPLHAFDYAKIGSKEVVVRRGHEGETFTTLDGVERTVGPDNIMVTNGQVSMALAGVMGGLDSEVTEATTTVAIEAASFEPTVTRKTSAQFNLRSESSSRFEKGINLGTIEEALAFAAALMAELGEGTVVSGEIVASEKIPANPVVTISLAKINGSLGTDLTVNGVNDIMAALGFAYEVNDETYAITIPSRRWDITIEEDIVEEVARIYGYDNLPSTLPSGESLPGALTINQRRVRRLRDVLEGSGLSEAISYALVTQAQAQEFVQDQAETVKLQSPMSEDHAVMRRSLISGLLTDVAYNVARKNLNVALYEVGNVFKYVADEKLPQQDSYLAMAMSGLWSEKSWNSTNQLVDFYLLKGIVEKALETIGATAIRFVPTQAIKEMHPGRTAEIVVGETAIGFVGQVHPSTAKAYDIRETYVCELNLDKLFSLELAGETYREVGKYPSVSRDIALLVNKSVTSQELVDVIQANGGKYLTNVALFDVFEGEKLGQDKKSMAYSLTFENSEATLVDEEITAVMDKITSQLTETLHAEIR